MYKWLREDTHKKIVFFSGYKILGGGGRDLSGPNTKKATFLCMSSLIFLHIFHNSLLLNVLILQLKKIHNIGRWLLGQISLGFNFIFGILRIDHKLFLTKPSLNVNDINKYRHNFQHIDYKQD